MAEPTLAYLQILADLFSETVVKTMTLRLLEETGAHDLTHSQYQALRYLHTHGRCTIGHIAEGLMVSPPASTKLVNRLVEKDLVRRTEGAADRRHAEVDLTPQGRDLIVRVRKTRDTRFATVMNRLSPAEKQALVTGLERFLIAAVKDEGVGFDICLRCGDDRLEECPVNTAQLEVLGPSLAPRPEVHWDLEPVESGQSR